MVFLQPVPEPAFHKCRRCPRPTELGKSHCRTCLDHIAGRMKALADRRAAEGVCVTCGQVPPEAANLRCVPCRDRGRARATRYSRKIRDKAWDHYGGAHCACCGETDHNFLSLDHVNNDGADHRRSLADHSMNFYQWLKLNNYPPGYQVLCMNCNMGRWRNGGTCPHKEARSADQPDVEQ